IVAGADERGMTLVSSEDFKSVTGQGVTGRIEGRAVALGNQHMMRELGVAIDAISADADSQRKDGHTVMFVAIDGSASSSAPPSASSWPGTSAFGPRELFHRDAYPSLVGASHPSSGHALRAIRGVLQLPL